MAGARRGLASAATHTRWLLGALTTALVALLLVAGAHARAAATEVTLEIWVPRSGKVTLSEPSLDDETECTSGNGVQCKLRYEAPKQLTLTAEGDPGYSFARWTSADCAQQTNPCVLDLAEDQQVTSVYTLFAPAFLSVRVSGDGRVTSDVGGVDCKSDGLVKCQSDALQPGQPVTFTVDTTQSVEWVFGCEPVSGNPKQCVARSENQIVGVKLGGAPGPDPPLDVDVMLRITKVGAGSGTVTGIEGFHCGTGAECSRRFPFGKLVGFEATADAGSRFDGWVGVCQSDPSCRFNVGPVTGVQARFVPATASPPPPSSPQPPPTTSPPPPPRTPPGATPLVRVAGLSAARVNGRWRVVARVAASQRVRARLRVGRAKGTWADRTVPLARGTTSVRLQLVRKATRGVCWFSIVARNADGQVQTVRKSVKLGR
jgi:hypothetical protein